MMTNFVILNTRINTSINSVRHIRTYLFIIGSVRTLIPHVTEEAVFGIITLLSRCLCSFCTDGLVDIIAGISAGFSLSQRLVDFRKTSYAKYTVPTSFCKGVGQIGHALGTIQSSFFFTFFYLYFTHFTVQCYRNLYIYTQIFFF